MKAVDEKSTGKNQETLLLFLLSFSILLLRYAEEKHDIAKVANNKTGFRDPECACGDFKALGQARETQSHKGKRARRQALSTRRHRKINENII